MLLSEFDYHLPPELIAQEPLADRSASRMLIVNRAQGAWTDTVFRELPASLGPGDCLVLNDSRVFPARLFGRKIGYERPVEIFLLQPESADRLRWRTLARPGRHMQPGTRIFLTPRLQCEVVEVGARGERVVLFESFGDIDHELEFCGHIPLPPYIHRPDTPADRERYQTVYAERCGSVAAPTAGLHFTKEILDACVNAGASIAKVTLHVGLGTFQPLGQEEVESNRLHSESYEIDAANAEVIGGAKRRIAVGTTSARTLETAAGRNGLTAQKGETDIFIHPGYCFKAVDALLTNFHLPKSSLLLLVSAFAGRELTMAAYEHAIREGYRFFSYGDCMLIL
jgi:S-adenosylmethionine:tRNA ribosyltransferase-isomerase